LLLEALDSRIKPFIFHDKHEQFKISFRDGSILYIVYNLKGEYAYQLLFSSQPLERVRVDSIDRNWDVDTRPDHFHPRGLKQGFNSPMKGIPADDIPCLLSLILSGDLKKSSKRF